MAMPVGTGGLEPYDGQGDIGNPDEVFVEEPGEGPDDAVIEALQKELLDHQMPVIPPETSADIVPEDPTYSAMLENEEKELAKRSPPTARISAGSYSTNPLAGVEGFESNVPTPAQPSVPSTYVYEPATYSPSFPTSVIYPEDEEIPPPLTLSPSRPYKSPSPNPQMATPQSASPPSIVTTEAVPPLVTPTQQEPTLTVRATASVSDADAPPKSDVDRLSDRLHEDPRDGLLWQVYINLVEQSGDMDAIETAYERLVDAFPNTPTAQIAYLSHFLTPTYFPKAEALFARFLRASPSVDLWKYYLIYVRRVNSNATEPNSRAIIRKAYEFALNHVGQDKDSGEIWKDYIDFLKGTETQTTWDAQQRMDAIRSAFHRAVVVPLENVEVLWRELDAFETNLNKITAKKFLGDLSPSYMTARTSLRDLRRLMESLSIPTIKLPSGTSAANLPLSLPSRPNWAGESDRNLCHAWKTYLKWEESNPLDIEDNSILQTRINVAYRKAVIRMRFFPEIWYMACNHLATTGKQDEALTLLKQGMDANPSSFLLHFAYAELCESLNKLSEAHSAFDSLIKALHSHLELAEATIASEVAAARASVPSTGVVNGELALERDEREKLVLEKHNKELEGMKGELGVVWIMLMRFARRAEGLRPARGIFTRARKDNHCPWSVYEAAALMEYHATKTAEVSTKIFELGMKQFASDVEFVVRYLGFLISINDDTNARALFESVISSFTPEKARPLWERWARYEYHFGDFAATQKLEKRIAEVYSNDPPIKRFAQRYTYFGIDAIAGRDLGFAHRAKQASTPPANTSVTPPAAPAVERERDRVPDRAPPTPRRASPEPRRRRDPSPPPAKRFKPSSPPPVRRGDRGGPRDHDRDRWDDAPPRRAASPAHPPRDSMPAPLTWFLSLLPSASAFDGPIFRTDDLMELLRHGNIPSPSTNPARGGASRNRSPPPPRGPPLRGRRY